MAIDGMQLFAAIICCAFFSSCEII